MGQAVAIAQGQGDMVEGGDCGLNPFRFLEHDAGARDGGDGKAVPIGQQALVAPGLGTLVARGQQHTALLGQQGFVRFIGGNRIAQAAWQVAALEIAVPRHAIDLLEAGREGAHQRGVDLRFAPGVEFAVFSFVARADRRGEAVADPHVAQQPFDGFGDALAAQFIAVELGGADADLDNLRIVIQHLLEHRLQPALVRAVTEEAAADMVMDAAEQHGVEGGENKLRELRHAGAQEGAPHQFQQQGIGKFYLAIQAAEEDVVILGDAQCRHVQVHILLRRGHVAIVEILQAGAHGGRDFRHLDLVGLVERGDIAQHTREGWNVLLVFAGQIARHPKGGGVGRQEDIERPAAIVAHSARSALID